MAVAKNVRRIKKMKKKRKIANTKKAKKYSSSTDFFERKKRQVVVDAVSDHTVPGTPIPYTTALSAHQSANHVLLSGTKSCYRVYVR